MMSYNTIKIWSEVLNYYKMADFIIMLAKTQLRLHSAEFKLKTVGEYRFEHMLSWVKTQHLRWVYAWDELTFENTAPVV